MIMTNHDNDATWVFFESVLGCTRIPSDLAMAEGAEGGLNIPPGYPSHCATWQQQPLRSGNVSL